MRAGIGAAIMIMVLVQMQQYPAEAVCCRVNHTAAATDSTIEFPSCNDGTVPPVGECCGVGRCNVFCCDCKGGCR